MFAWTPPSRLPHRPFHVHRPLGAGCLAEWTRQRSHRPPSRSGPVVRLAPQQSGPVSAGCRSISPSLAAQAAVEQWVTSDQHGGEMTENVLDEQLTAAVAKSNRVPPTLKSCEVALNLAGA
ncbi:unnamed protein product [Lampetra planeri]